MSIPGYGEGGRSMKQDEGPKDRAMKTFLKCMLGMIVLVGLLASGCATEGKYPRRMDPNPFYGTSWWGSDPVCSPGCPAGLSGSGY